MTDRETEKGTSTELLARAQRAINQGDVVEMLCALEESHYLDGLSRRLSMKWSHTLPAFEIDDCIAEAVDSVCDAVFKGREIQNLRAWLWKCSSNLAYDKWRFDYSKREDYTATEVYDDDPLEPDEKREIRQKLKENNRNAAIRVARELLPQIGTGRLHDVMELVIDAAEDGTTRPTYIIHC